MRNIKTLIASGLVTALAISALAVPVSAASKGHATIVNGIPGAKIDVCLGNKTEAKSNLKYGGVVKKRLLGKKVLVFRKASAGTCKGKYITARTVKFPSGSDKTVVVTSAKPDRVLVFDNSKLGTQVAVGEPTGAMALRHAADLKSNSVQFFARHWEHFGDVKYEPSAYIPFKKGSQKIAGTHANPSLVSRVGVTRMDGTTMLGKSPIFQIEALKRYEFIFVGNSSKNSKLVMVTSKLSAPPAP